MRSIQEEIKNAARSLGIGSDEFRRLDERREHKVLQDVKRHFLTDFDAESWWEAFRYESDVRMLDRGYRSLPELCPNDGKKIWLIPCQDRESVYDTYPHAIIHILDECPPFEYAVADKKLQWLFLENRHGMMYATGSPAIARLRAIV